MSQAQIRALPVGCANATGCCNPNATAQECPCQDVDLCPDLGYSGASGPDDPSAYAPQPPKTFSQDILDKKQPAPPPVYTDPATGSCQRRGDEPHCWCTLGMDQPATVSDMGSTTGNHGSGSILSLKFDPQTTFDADLNPLPFGESNFHVTASANFAATATIKLPIIQPQVMSILDVGATVNATRCSLNTSDTHFKVLGKQFTDLGVGEPFDAGTAPAGNAVRGALKTAKEACETSLVAYIDAADRAKKALKDVQILLRYYNQLTSNETWGPAEFCAAVRNVIGSDGLPMAANDDGFPAGTCETDSIEKTINRFVDYYTSRVDTLLAQMQDLPLKTASLVDALHAAQPQGSIPLLHFDRSGSATIASTQFFVGPIPVSITLDVASTFKIDGMFEYGFYGFNRFGMQVGDTAHIIAASGKLVPGAGASLALFAGVGIDVPGFAVKAGVEGRLVLVEANAILTAGAGLSMRVKDDTRPPPSDAYSAATASIEDKQLYFKPTQTEYFVDWFYEGELTIPKVLEGTLNAKLKLKALFFSKTFSKTLLTFGPAFKLVPGVKLFSGGGELAKVNLPVVEKALNTLGDFEMQLPFQKLHRLPERAPNRTAKTFVLTPGETPLHYQGVCDILRQIPN